MSLSSTTSRNDYVGNASVSAYSYNFRIFLATDLLVTIADTSTPPVQTTLAINTDYTVTGAGASNGGSITLVNSGQSWLSGGNLKTGYRLTVRRVRPLTQTTDIRNQGSFYPETHEDSFDHLVMLAQQIQDVLNRSAKNPETLPLSSFDPTLPTTPIPGAALIINALGTGFDQSVSGSTIPTIGGTRAAPRLISAAGAIPVSTGTYDQTVFVAGNAAAVSSAASPFGSAGPVGSKIVVVGCDAVNTVTLSQGGNLIMNGPYAMGADSEIVFKSDGTNYRESTRNGL